MLAAGARASNQRDRGMSSGGGWRRGACRRAAVEHKMRLASSSSPAATIPARTRAGSALQQNRAIGVRQDARRAIAIPPRHQPAAATLLFRAGDLQHGRLAVVPDGHKQA